MGWKEQMKSVKEELPNVNEMSAAPASKEGAVKSKEEKIMKSEG